MQTSEEDSFFSPDGLFQIYKLTGKDTWTRQPDYKKSRELVWYKSLKAAKDRIKELEKE